MNSKIQIFALGAAMLTLGACSSNGDEPQIEPSKFITVSTEIGTMSRVTTDADGSQSFADGDEISVYAWTGKKDEAPAADVRVVNNSVNTLTSGAWVATPQMLWKDMVTPHYFIGVYPAIEQEKGLDNDLTKYAYTLNSENQTASDLLVAVNTSGKKASDAEAVVPLQFTHVMAKVIVNLSFRNQWGTDAEGNNVKPEVGSVKICDAVKTAAVDLLTKKVTATENEANDIAVPEVEKNTSYSSIFIPQSNVRKVAIAIDDKTYTFTNAEDIRFESGKITTINLIVGRNKIELDGVTISPWEGGTIIEGGEAQVD